MTRLILVRHGNTDDNLRHLLCGLTDSPLNEVGTRQAEYSAKELQQFVRSGNQVSAIYASPLQRTAKTAQLIADLLGLPVYLNHGLIEMNMGIFEGTSIFYLEETQKDLMQRAMQPGDEEFCWEGGETRREIFERMETTMRSIAAKHSDETVVVVTHGGVISYFLTGISGKPLSHWNDYYVANCSLSNVIYENDTFVVEYYNQHDHVPKEEIMEMVLSAKQRLGIEH